MFAPFKLCFRRGNCTISDTRKRIIVVCGRDKLDVSVVRDISTEQKEENLLSWGYTVDDDDIKF